MKPKHATTNFWHGQWRVYSYCACKAAHKINREIVRFDLTEDMSTETANGFGEKSIVITMNGNFPARR